MPVSPALYRDAMARLGAAVNVVTSLGPAGRIGFTASAVCSVTDDPPTLLVCMNRDSPLNEAFKANGIFCVNVLAASQQALSPLFAGFDGSPMEQRFAAADWQAAATGAPVLMGAVASFDCRIAQVVEVGTHSVLFGEVLAITEGASCEALMYFRRTYHPIGI
jgi:flavin reductase